VAKQEVAAYIVIVGAMLAGGLAAWADLAAAQGRPPWTYERCFTTRCIADVLNRLSPDEAAAAKLTTWRDSTDVWYRGTAR
jgi:hypothetical protein